MEEEEEEEMVICGTYCVEIDEGCILFREILREEKLNAI